MSVSLPMMLMGKGTARSDADRRPSATGDRLLQHSPDESSLSISEPPAKTPAAFSFLKGVFSFSSTNSPKAGRGSKLNLPRVSISASPSFEQLADAAANSQVKFFSSEVRSGFVDPSEIGEHEEHPISIPLTILSGIICGTLLFAFSVVFAIILVGKVLPELIPLMIAQHLLSTFVIGTLLTRFSGCEVAVGGVDINPTVFMATAIVSVTSSSHYQESSDEVKTGTVIALLALAAVMMGATFCIVGVLRMTRVIQYMPLSLISGFIVCVGFSVLTESISVGTGEHFAMNKAETYKEALGSWRQWKSLLPSIFVGAGLYSVKRFQLKNPTVLLPLALFGPLILFYIFVYISGHDLESAREENWLDERVDALHFWEIWPKYYSSFGRLNPQALAAGIPGILGMIVVVTIDVLLKIAAAERIFAIDLNFDYEMMLNGLVNFVSAGFSGIPGFMQMKLTLVNFGIVHNTKDRIVGVISSAICLLLFVSSYPLINAVPRFFLSGLLVYAALGFIIEQGWDSRKFLSKKDYVAVWIVVVVKIFYNLLPAVAVGLVLATFSFAHHYAKRSEAKSIFEGKEMQSRATRTWSQVCRIEASSKRIFGIQLQGLLFFGSASKLQALVEQRIADDEKEIKPWRKLKYLVLDFEHVVGIDASVSAAFGKLLRLTERKKINVVWSAVPYRIVEKLLNEKEVKAHMELYPTYDSLEEAMEFCENCVLRKAEIVQSKFFLFPKMRKLNAFQSWHSLQDVFDEIFEVHAEDFGKYCFNKTIDAGEVLYSVGQKNDNIFILRRGKISLYLPKPRSSKKYRLLSMSTGALFSALLSPICVESAILESRCTFTVIPMEKMKLMKREKPEFWGALLEEFSRFGQLLQKRSQYHMQPEHLYSPVMEILHEFEMERGKYFKILTCLAEAAKRVTSDEARRKSVLELLTASGRDNLPELTMRQRIEYMEYFNATKTVVPSSGELGIPLRNLSKSCLDLGYFCTDEELKDALSTCGIDGSDQYVDCDQFLSLMRFIVLEQVSKEDLSRLEKCFVFMDKDASLSVSVSDLYQVVSTFAPGEFTERDLSKVIDRWSNRSSGGADAELTFKQFESMMAYAFNLSNMSDLRPEFKTFSRGKEFIAEEDIKQIVFEQTGENASAVEVKEMLQELDQADKGYASFDDFQALVNRVYDGEYSVFWDWKAKSARVYNKYEAVSMNDVSTPSKRLSITISELKVDH